MTCDYRSHQFATFLPVSRSLTAKIRPPGLYARCVVGLDDVWIARMDAGLEPGRS